MGRPKKSQKRSPGALSPHGEDLEKFRLALGSGGHTQLCFTTYAWLCTRELLLAELSAPTGEGEAGHGVGEQC